MTDKMILRVKAGLSWGFMIHVPFQTASPQPIPYPPPTTLVGALAAAYARWKGYPETLLFNGRPYSFAVRLLLDKMVYYVSAGYPYGGVVLYRDLMRVLALPYLQQKTPDYWFSVQAFGKAYTPTILDIVYLVDRNYCDELASAAWGINRVGSREGMVSIKSVELYDPCKCIVEEDIVETPYYVPVRLVEPYRSCEVYPMWKLDPLVYTNVSPKDYYKITEYYVVPVGLGIYGGNMIVKPKDNALTVDIGGEKLVLPRDLIGCIS